MNLFELHLLVDERGVLTVTGNIDNLPQCYAALEQAKDSIRAFAVEKKTQIQQAKASELIVFGRKEHHD